jgi:hypothetical protein
MATILIKKRDTTGAPSAGDLTNSAGGAELAVNTADKRLYAKDSGGNVVELGTAPSTVDINSGSIDGTPIGASSASTGAFTTLSSNSTTTLNGTTIPASKTLLVSTDIGTSVQAYDADTAKYDDTTANFTGTLQNGGSNVVVDTDIGSTVQAYDADTAKYDDTTANFTGTLQNGGSNVLVDTDIGVNVQAYDVDTAKYDDTTANFTGTLQNGGSDVVVDTDIGSTVQAYDADTAKYDDTTANFTGTLQNGGSNVLVDTDIGSTVQAYDADTAKYDDTTANFTGTLQNGGSNVLVDTDIGSSVLAYDSNLQGFVTAFTLPTTDGTVDQVLKTDGAGNIGFATVSGGGGTPGGSDTQIQYNNAGSFAGASGLVTDGSNLTLNAQGDLRFADSDSSNWVAFQAPATIASNVTWTLPDADGTDGQVIKTNGTGTLSWITPAAGGGGGGTSVTVTQITATASQTDFSVTYTVGQLSVYLNGALLASADYTATNGTTVVLAAGAASGDIFTAVAYDSATQITVGDSKVEVTDTGSDGTITFDTDGSERMRITNAGNVGIGTSSPARTLDVAGDVYIGAGAGDAIAALSAQKAAGTDQNGTNIVIQGGTCTGEATGGYVGLFPAIDGIGTGTTQRAVGTKGFIVDFLYPSTNNNSSLYGCGYTFGAAGQINYSGYTTGSRSIVTIDGAATGIGSTTLEIVGASNLTNARQGLISFFGSSSKNPYSTIFCRTQGGTYTSGALGIEVYSTGTVYTGFEVSGTGQPYFPNHNTTASAANAFLNSSGGILQRSTSSIRYKTDVESIWTQNADAVLNLRPVWYRSLCEGDNNGWSWYGLIAEEVAEVEPRLVHWAYLPDAYEEVTRNTVDEDGNEVLDDDGNVMPYTEKVLKADAEMVPDGVQYDRLTVLLLDIVKRQNERIETLEAKVAALEGN